MVLILDLDRKGRVIAEYVSICLSKRGPHLSERIMRRVVLTSTKAKWGGWGESWNQWVVGSSLNRWFVQRGVCV